MIKEDGIEGAESWCKLRGNNGRRKTGALKGLNIKDLRRRKEMRNGERSFKIIEMDECLMALKI